MEEKIKKDKVLLKCLSSLLVIVVIIIGVSFAIFQSFARQTTTNQVGTLSCFTVSFEGVTSALNLTNEYPITDKEGFQKEPYVFKVTNNCTQYLTLNIGVETLSSSQIAANLIKGVIVPNGGIPKSAVLLSNGVLLQAQNGGTAYGIFTDIIKPSQSKSYDLRLWFDENMTKAQGASKKYQGKVIVSATAENQPTFADVILKNNEVEQPLTTPGLENNLENEALLASAQDDYGTSYYFRGVVKNNYVTFANMCWRIVRITGDGSVKLVLHNQDSQSVNPCSSTENADLAAFPKFAADDDGTTKFNNDSSSNTYVGFMYGSSSASSYASAQANTNKSVILQELEYWYKSAMTAYDDMIADVIWCNDKSIVTDANFNPQSAILGTKYGYSDNINYYGAAKRLVPKNIFSAGGDGPSLICQKDYNSGKLSKFTVSDTVNGNGALSYKVGLLTADEVAYAGLVVQNINSTSNYLFENTGNYYWWTMTPFEYLRTAEMFVVSKNIFYNYTTDKVSYRPTIALKSTTVVSGTGTSEDPYVVQ